MNTLSKWICNIIENELSSKVNARQLLETIENNPELISLSSAEIQSAIEIYNQSRKLENILGFPQELFKNASHLAKVWDEVLPDYTVIIDRLELDQKIFHQVMTELKESTYFKEVYEIRNTEYLIQNLIILFYRTSLLFMFPILREKSAQISSTVEEMAAALALHGRKTQLFYATKSWLQNWQVEDFSQKLVEKLEENHLI